MGYGYGQSAVFHAVRNEPTLSKIDHKTALENAFAAAILTEWDEFKSYDWNAIESKMMQPARVFDGRNILGELKMGAHIYSLGKTN